MRNSKAEKVNQKGKQGPAEQHPETVPRRPFLSSGRVDAGTIVKSDGLFFLQSRVGFKHVTDGTSHTVQVTLGTRPS